MGQGGREGTRVREAKELGTGVKEEEIEKEEEEEEEEVW